MLRGLFALLVVLGIVALMVGLGRAGGENGQGRPLPPPVIETPPAVQKPATPGIVRPIQIVLECETPKTLEDKAPNGEVMLRVGRANLGQSVGFLEVPEKAIDRAGQAKLPGQDEQGGLVSGKAAYEFQVPRDDAYYIFLRAKWMDYCGDSVWLRCDAASYFLIHDNIGFLSEANYKWAWHPAMESAEPKVFKLTAGKHTLELSVKEDGPQFDKILISTDATPPSETVVFPAGGVIP